MHKLESLGLRSARRSSASLMGERRSRARGQSVEFADHRNYSSGDDFRYVDWNLYGRLEKLFLKLYEEERELPVLLVLDRSESMRFGSPSKFGLARVLAGGIATVALAGFDRVSVRCFPAEGIPSAAQEIIRSVRGKKALGRFLTALESVTPSGNAPFSEALTTIARESRGRGLAVVISDFLDEAGYQAGLEAFLSRGHDVVAIQILSPEEVRPDAYGDLRLVDAETGLAREVTFGKFRLAAYQKMVNGYCGRLKEYCASRGIRQLFVRSDAVPKEVLLKQFRSAGILTD